MIGVAVAAAVWMVRSLIGSLLAPSCAPPPGIPDGHDGFVPLDRIAPPPGRRS
ncbi:MAG: hypothetical protein WCH79_13295 [Planctomycetia bacterium]